MQQNTLQTKGMVEFGSTTPKSHGYLVVPKTVRAGVLVLHAWWGLNDFFKSLADRFAGEGYAAFAPDFHAGKVAHTVEEAKELTSKMDDNANLKVALSAVDHLASHPAMQGRQVGVIGFSMGAAYSLWLSTQRPENVAASVIFYGTWPIDFSKSRSSYLGHFSPQDEWEPIDGIHALESKIRADGRPVEFHLYPGTKHWFFENDRADAYNPKAADLAWTRTLEFFQSKLGQPR